MNAKRLATRLFVPFMALVMILLLTTACAMSGQPAGANAAAAAPAPVRAAKDVTAQGKLVPQRSAALGLPASGVIAEVAVQEGAQVDAGQLILRLRNDQQTAAVAQARATVQKAQAQMAETQAGSRPQEIASAKAALEAAEAALAKLKQDPRPEDIAVARSGLAIAVADRQKANEASDPEQLISARAELANAEAEVRLKQADYDGISWRPDAGRFPQALALEKATNELTAARARVAGLQKGSSAATRAKADAGVQQAQAELAKVTAPIRPADTAAAEADVRRAQAELALLEAGALPETVRAAEAAVAVAQADLKKAEAALAETELRAPFAGAIVTLDAKAGEQVGAGTVVARLADLSAWQVETTDLTELAVTRVREGAPARLSFDAVPGLELAGKVAGIRSLADNRQGDMVYTVTVVPDASDPRLRWNMTAQVAIAPQE